MTETSHDAVREALLDCEPGDLSGALLAHYEGCAQCAAFGRALSEIDEGLGGLPPVAAPRELLARTRAAVDELPRTVSRPAPAGMTALFLALIAALFSGIWALLELLAAPFRARRPWMIALPAVAVLGLVFVGGTSMVMLGAERGPVPVGSSPSFGPDVSAADQEGASGGDAPPPTADPAFQGAEGSVADALADAEGDFEDQAGRFDYGLLGPGNSRDRTGTFDTATAEVARNGLRVEPAPGTTEPELVVPDRWAQVVMDGRTLDESRVVVDLPAARHTVRLAELEQNHETAAAERTVERSVVERSVVERSVRLRAQSSERSRLLAADQNAAEEEGSGPPPARPAATPSSGTTRGPVGGTADRASDAHGGETTLLPGADDDGRHYWASIAPSVREQTEGLTFRSPTGYWANTYVPGDPEVRSLRRRLRDYPAAVELAELAQPGEPGLSAPRSGALSLDVSADRAQIEGRSRVLMSVGLRGAAQRAGRRPALRAQVVLDLRGHLDEDGEGRVRALLSSLGRRRDGADRVGVMVAGPDGGTRVELGTMRFGELSVALRRTFGPTPDDARPVTLRESLEDAIASVGQLDQDAPLGSSMVLLVTPGLSDADSRELARSAHFGALAGVTTTVIGLDDRVALDSLERVALAGQGRRRVLESAGSADELVRGEITAVSRVLARAVRLRIRLAAGVQLVDVIGSRSLDEHETQRVREAERAIDQTLARRLGITSDRGDDEDGIQIVIPAFYADDAHRVLLDLLVPGPGPVADVQVRYKDLLRLGNGTLTDRLVISRGGAARGPAERAVYAAWLGHELSGALRAAASELDHGRPDSARAMLEGARMAVVTAWAQIPELASEPALTRDVSLCQRYRDALAAQPADVMATSLRFAAHRRLLGDPLGLGGDR